MSIYDKASLVLIPSGTKTSKVYSQKPTNGDGDFTFSRSTAATRVNASGNIEKETQNLLLQSNQFDTTWTLDSGMTLTNGQSGYDGSSDAWLLSKPAASYREMVQSISLSGVNTYSIYAKAGTLTNVTLRFISTSGNHYARFNLSTGAVISTTGNVFDTNVEDIGSGWYRCSATANVTASSVYVYPDIESNNTAGNIYIQDAQLEQGLVARDYIETTTTAVDGGITDNVPRLDYTDSSCPALLLEPQRSNSFPQSEYPSTSTLNLVNGGYTWTHNQTNSPEGIQNASKWAAANNNAVVGVYQNFSATSGASYTFSVFAKKGDHNLIQLQNGGGGSGANSYANFDLENGTKSDGATITDSFINDFGNGWYRIGITFTTSSTGTSNCSIDIIDSLSAGRNSTFTGSVGDYFYVWGMQVEAGSYATSYIPTYGSAVTRNGDGAEITGATDLIGQAEGTIFLETYFTNTGGTQVLLSPHDGAANKRLEIWSNNNVVNGFIGGSVNIAIGNTTISNGVHKMAIAYKSGDSAFYVDGVQIGTSTTAFTIPALTTLAYNQYTGLLRPTESVKQTLVFKTRLTNAELADLTTI